jgi:hypothetical protein
MTAGMLCSLLMLAGTAAGEDWMCGEGHRGACGAVSRPACAKARYTDKDLKGELLAILQETWSPDTFLVTLELLAELDAGNKRLIPIIIRNAERVGVFGNTPLKKWNEKQNHVAECLGLFYAKEKQKAAATLQPGMTLPTGQYLSHPPQFVPATPQYTLPPELSNLQDATTTSQPPPMSSKGTSSQGASGSSPGKQ